ncbi:hypothetical protein ACJIZ3_009338 [Penstemon smallii]|uniref:Uncharacterized protein n=1 Tax=Penstemon smallii TaxID=265156 RepID=A0ABD3TC84_9LAMI
MNLRNSVNGRPSGTDGSDFSYRMVVDSRYTKVAQGKSHLSALIFTQAFIQVISTGVLFLSTPLDRVYGSSIVCCFVSLLLGRLGRNRSKVGLLKLYLFGSSVAVIISVASLLNGENSFEIIKNSSIWETSNFELFKIAAVLLGVVVQILSISVTSSLARNMAPPKRAS